MEKKYAYIGKRPCGCIAAATLVMDDRLEDTANDVADFIKEGLIIERVEIQQDKPVRIQDCSHI